jgi:hypothetical protein
MEWTMDGVVLNSSRIEELSYWNPIEPTGTWQDECIVGADSMYRSNWMYSLGKLSPGESHQITFHEWLEYLITDGCVFEEKLSYTEAGTRLHRTLLIEDEDQQ